MRYILSVLLLHSFQIQYHRKNFISSGTSISISLISMQHIFWNPESVRALLKLPRYHLVNPIQAEGLQGFSDYLLPISFPQNRILVQLSLHPWVIYIPAGLSVLYPEHDLTSVCEAPCASDSDSGGPQTNSLILPVSLRRRRYCVCVCVCVVLCNATRNDPVSYLLCTM